MDLIYIILSVFLRLSPAVRKVSRATRRKSSRNQRFGELGLVDLAFWLPLVGWISVSVEHLPDARWLQWRVRSVLSFGEAPHSGRSSNWWTKPFDRGGNGPPQDHWPD